VALREEQANGNRQEAGIMNLAEIQSECYASDEMYRAYFKRHFSLRRADGSVAPVERVTQEVLHELVRLQRIWEASPGGLERLRVGRPSVNA
jgi:hypothetical protein